MIVASGNPLIWQHQLERLSPGSKCMDSDSDHSQSHESIIVAVPRAIVGRHDLLTVSSAISIAVQAHRAMSYIGVYFF